MEQDTVTERIKILVTTYADKPADFAKATGLTNQNVYDLTSGRKGGPSLASIKKLLITFPEVSERWLLLGEGEMLKSAESPNNFRLHSAGQGQEQKQEGQSQANQNRREVLIATVDTAGDPTYTVVNYKAAANYLNGYQSQEYYENLGAVTMPRALVGSSRQGIFLQIDGDSMTPRFQHGDWVAAVLLDSSEWYRVKDSDCCVIVSNSRGIQFKRVKNRLKSPLGFIRCKSDNRRHPAFNLDREDLLQIFRFVLHVSSDASNPDDSLYKKVDYLEDTTSDLRVMYEQLAQQLSDALKQGQLPPISEENSNKQK